MTDILLSCFCSISHCCQMWSILFNEHLYGLGTTGPGKLSTPSMTVSLWAVRELGKGKGLRLLALLAPRSSLVLCHFARWDSLLQNRVAEWLGCSSRLSMLKWEPQAPPPFPLSSMAVQTGDGPELGPCHCYCSWLSTPAAVMDISLGELDSQVLPWSSSIWFNSSHIRWYHKKLLDNSQESSNNLTKMLRDCVCFIVSPGITHWENIQWHLCHDCCDLTVTLLSSNEWVMAQQLRPRFSYINAQSLFIILKHLLFKKNLWKTSAVGAVGIWRRERVLGVQG